MSAGRAIAQPWHRAASALARSFIPLMLIALLSGCDASISAPLTPAETAQIRNGQAAVLLVRLACTDQRGVACQPLMQNLTQGLIRLGLGDFDSGGELQDFFFRAPSDAAWADGWFMLVRPPGYYYFTPQRPEDSANILVTAGRHRPVILWRIEVPAGVPVMYAGTIVITERSDPGIFDRLWTGIDATNIRDDSAAAARLVARDLPGLPPPVTRLAVRHTGPIRLGVP